VAARRADAREQDPSDADGPRISRKLDILDVDRSTSR